MKNKTKTLLIILSILILLIISLLALVFALKKDYLSRMDKSEDLVNVMVAKDDIPKDSVIYDYMVEVKNVNSDKLSEDNITNIRDVIGKTSTADINKGEYFTYSNVK